MHGWTSAEVLVAGGAGAAALAAFVLWEATQLAPDAPTSFFRGGRSPARSRRHGDDDVALMGSLFVLTQFLQFQLGYSPLQAGVRMLPAAGSIAVHRTVLTAARAPTGRSSRSRSGCCSSPSDSGWSRRTVATTY